MAPALGRHTDDALGARPGLVRPTPGPRSGVDPAVCVSCRALLGEQGWPVGAAGQPNGDGTSETAL